MGLREQKQAHGVKPGVTVPADLSCSGAETTLVPCTAWPARFTLGRNWGTRGVALHQAYAPTGMVRADVVRYYYSCKIQGLLRQAGEPFLPYLASL